MSAADPGSLYLCYFGLREPLVQTQVLPYLRQLRKFVGPIGILTFEAEDPTGWSGDTAKDWEHGLAEDGINWVWRRYHKRPQVLSTLYDILIGSRAARSYMRTHGHCILHARGHWAAAMAAPVARSHRVPFLFDIRGLAPEEYVDAGLWRPAGFRYSAAKRLERRLIDAADGFVVLTNRASQLLFPGCVDEDSRGRPVRVIPCCVDPSRFESAWSRDRADLRRELGFGDARVFVYLGALGGWYMADEMARFLTVALESSPRGEVLLITQSDTRVLLDPLERFGVPLQRVRAMRLPPEEVPRYLRAADAGVSFIKPSYSKQASSPTKVAEYLAAGLPLVCNRGVGDVDALVKGREVGVLIPELNQAGYSCALLQLEELLARPGIREHCRDVAREQFDLVGVGATAYLDLYRRLGASSLS